MWQLAHVNSLHIASVCTLQPGGERILHLDFHTFQTLVCFLAWNLQCPCSARLAIGRRESSGFDGALQGYRHCSCFNPAGDPRSAQNLRYMLQPPGWPDCPTGTLGGTEGGGCTPCNVHRDLWMTRSSGDVTI